MAKLTKICIDRLNNVALRRVLPVSGEGNTLHGTCPKCGKGGKVKRKWQGLYVCDDDRNRKHYVGCSECDFKAGGGTINVMMKFHDVGFLEACELIHKDTGIELQYEEERESMDFKSFCTRQLEASGLTYEDVRAKVIVGSEQAFVSPFQMGSVNVQTGAVDSLADEMIILYYDLEGRRVTGLPAKAKTKEVGYTRMRYSNPAAHPDKDGKPTKYITISGMKSRFYIPDKIRQKYRDKVEIETLFIQEGEKKAEKACKHGIDSIAIQGISNIGNKEDGLPPDLQYLVDRCKVKNVVFLMDADWNDLSGSLTENSYIESRPRSFALAVIKFRKYVSTLWQCGLHVDIWHAHINRNDAGDKGVDDLLCNTLKDREEELALDIQRAMGSHDGKGTYADVVNISSFSEYKIKDLWSLNNKDDFFNAHMEEILKLHTFRFGEVFYKVSDGKIVVASEMGVGREFWTKWTDDKGKKHVEFELMDILEFLQANGFRARYAPDGKRILSRIVDGVIDDTDEYFIRLYILNHVYKSTKDKEVKYTITKSVTSMLSVPNLGLLENLEFSEVRNSNFQRFYFRDVEVTVSGIEVRSEKLIGPVWKDNVVQRNFKRIPIFAEFSRLPDGNFSILTTKQGEECEFLRFLVNTSNHFGKGNIDNEASQNILWHLANKITAIGYLLRDYKYLNEAKIVVAMDANISEVGQSKGRTGKSLIGKAIEQFIKQTVIDGRNTTNDDQFIFSEVSEKTKNVFIDDIKASFDIGNFYQRITGNLNVNVKQGARMSIRFEDSPKFYITTNHAIDNLDDSAMARILFMSFSPWYTKDYTPFSEFGHSFFQDWDDLQWCLFDNLMIECVMIYIRSHDEGWGGHGIGGIDPPMHDLRRRELRQKMGENFLNWAELYFAPDAGHINCRINRKEMTDRYLLDNNLKMITPQSFRTKLEAFCEYSGLHLNATRKSRNYEYYVDFIKNNPGRSFIGDRDTSGGIEYFSVTTTEFNSSQNQ